MVGALIFLPAGRLSFFNGWLLMGILFIPMLIAGIVMTVKSPKLLESRLDAKEKQREQSASYTRRNSLRKTLRATENISKGSDTASYPLYGERRKLNGE